MRFLVSGALAFSVPASADALLDSALANGGAYDANQWAYVSNTKLWSGGSTVIGDLWDRMVHGARQKTPLRVSQTVTFDPSKPSGTRQSVRVSVGDSAVIDTDEKDGVPAYSELRQLVQGRPQKLAETAATVTYRVKIDPTRVRKLGAADFEMEGDLPSLDGRIIVVKTGPHAPYISVIRAELPKGAVGNAAGKIKHFSFAFRFAPDPQTGVQLIRASGIDASVQGLGLVTVDMSALNRLGSYRKVR
jgi:hypothetical protein